MRKRDRRRGNGCTEYEESNLLSSISLRVRSSSRVSFQAEQAVSPTPETCSANPKPSIVPACTAPHRQPPLFSSQLQSFPSHEHET